MAHSPYDLIAEEYYDDFHKTSRNFDEATKGTIKDIVDLIPDEGLILDIGSGKGRVCEYLGVDSNRVIQLDSSQKMLQLEPREKCLMRVLSNAEKLPFLNADFICVTAFLCDPYLGLNFISEAYRVLKEGGVFLATNPTYRWALALREVLSLKIRLTRFKTKNGIEIKLPSIVVPDEQLIDMLKVSGFDMSKINITEYTLPKSTNIISPDIKIAADKLNLNIFDLPILTRIIARK